MAVIWDETLPPAASVASTPPHTDSVVWDDEKVEADDRPPFLERSLARLKKGSADASGELKMMPLSVVESLTSRPAGAPPRHTDNYATIMRKALGGDIIPAVSDVATDAVMTAGKAVLPEAIQDGLSGVADYVASSAPVQLLGEGLAAWKNASPESYETAGDTANIISALSPRPRLKTSVGTDARASAETYRAASRKKGIEKLLRPSDVVNAKGRVAEEGLFRSRTYKPADFEQRMYAEVDKVKGVDPERSNLFNMNAVDAEVGRIREGLDAKLATAPPISVKSVMGDVDSAVREVGRNPALVGDAGVAAQRIYGKFADIVEGYASKTGQIDPVDLLQARRDLQPVQEL